MILWNKAFVLVLAEVKEFTKCVALLFSMYLIVICNCSLDYTFCETLLINHRICKYFPYANISTFTVKTLLLVKLKVIGRG